MRKLLTTTILLLVVVLAAPMWAQTTGDVYQVHPFVDRVSPLFIQIVNPGVQGTPISPDHGTVCADIYVFDSNQEMLACCSCPITANGTLTMSATDLQGNTLTRVRPPYGAYKIVSDQGANCDARNPIPTPDLRAWGMTVAHSHFEEAPLSAAEQQFLGQACSFVLYLGSGQGTCNCPANGPA
jgi:hypothetical protein